MARIICIDLALVIVTLALVGQLASCRFVDQLVNSRVACSNERKLMSSSILTVSVVVVCIIGQNEWSVYVQSRPVSFSNIRLKSNWIQVCTCVYYKYHVLSCWKLSSPLFNINVMWLIIDRRVSADSLRSTNINTENVRHKHY